MIHTITLSFLNGHQVLCPIPDGARLMDVEDLFESEVYRITGTSYLTHTVRFFSEDEVFLTDALVPGSLLYVLVDVRPVPLIFFQGLECDSPLSLVDEADDDEADDNWLRTRI
jgi:hypothetical protein